MEVSIEAGELNHRITIEEDTGSTTGTTGNHVPDWNTWSGLTDGKCWASVRPISGRILERAALTYPEATHLITVRYMEGIKPLLMRAVLGGRKFRFGSVLDVNEAHVKLEILAAETVDV